MEEFILALTETYGLDPDFKTIFAEMLYHGTRYYRILDNDEQLGKYTLRIWKLQDKNKEIKG